MLDDSPPFSCKDHPSALNIRARASRDAIVLEFSGHDDGQRADDRPVNTRRRRRISSRRGCMLAVMVEFNLFKSSPDAYDVEAGTALFTEGEPGDVMYAVIDGQIDVTLGGHVVEQV